MLGLSRSDSQFVLAQEKRRKIKEEKEERKTETKRRKKKPGKDRHRKTEIEEYSPLSPSGELSVDVRAYT
jgi:hypothetical protein